MNTTQAKAAIESILKSEERREAVNELETKWAEHFDKAISAGGGLGGLSVPAREPIIGNWFKKGDLGFIYGERGLGKTWLAMFIARKCGEGGGIVNLPEWNVHGQRRVLYVDGEMPLDGTSRREDAAFWIIRLSELRSAAESQQGAKFLTQFVKNRNATEADCPPLEWGFIRPPNDSKVLVSWKKLSVPILFRQCVEEGVSSATDIAGIMAISKAQVSRYATRAMKEGWLIKNGRGYEVKRKSEVNAGS